MNADDSNVNDLNIHHNTECFSLSSVTFIEDRFFVFSAFHHSPYPRMIWIPTTILILFRRLQWRIAVLLVQGKRWVSPFYHPSIHQTSTLEKTKSSVLSTSFQQSKSSLTVKRRFENTNSRPIMTEEVWKNWMKRSSRSKKNFIARKQKKLQRRDEQLLREQLLRQNWDLREAHQTSLKEMEDLKKFQSSTFEVIARRRLVEDRDTILGFTGEIQELQNEINCLSDSRDFQDAESVRSGLSHVPSQPASFPPFLDPGRMLWV